MTASITGWGIQYERPVSRDSARKLCEARGFMLPRIGYELDLVIHNTVEDVGSMTQLLFNRRSRLLLINWSGRYVLASPDRERAEWRTVFGVDPVHPCVPVDSTPAAGIPSDGQNLGRDCNG